LMSPVQRDYCSQADAQAGQCLGEIQRDGLGELALVLDKKYRDARPKRLRFAIFNDVGRVVHHARDVFMWFGLELPRRIIEPGLRRLRLAAWPAG